MSMQEAPVKTSELATAMEKHLERTGQVVMSNTFPAGYRFECDLLLVKKSLYWTEYEIKTSVADFRKDFQKQIKGYYHGPGEQWPVRNKHEFLSGDGQNRRDGKPIPKPKQFYFVMPEGIVGIEDIPSHCGLILFGSDPCREKKTISIARRAPVLKGHNKMTNSMLFNLLLKK